MHDHVHAHEKKFRTFVCWPVKYSCPHVHVDVVVDVHVLVSVNCGSIGTKSLSFVNNPGLWQSKGHKGIAISSIVFVAATRRDDNKLFS